MEIRVQNEGKGNVRKASHINMMSSMYTCKTFFIMSKGMHPLTL